MVELISTSTCRKYLLPTISRVSHANGQNNADVAVEPTRNMLIFPLQNPLQNSKRGAIPAFLKYAETNHGVNNLKLISERITALNKVPYLLNQMPKHDQDDIVLSVPYVTHYQYLHSPKIPDCFFLVNESKKIVALCVSLEYYSIDSEKFEFTVKVLNRVAKLEGFIGNWKHTQGRNYEI